MISGYLEAGVLHGLDRRTRLKGKALERLSSGRRINGAADDTAGLSIATGMKSVTRSLTQAQRNIQDGISLLQVADGGLEGILSPPLMRMRELAMQAANGTLTAEQRRQIQEEIEQLRESVTQIATSTEFNGIKALRPPIASQGGTTAGQADIVFVVDNTGSMAPTQTEVATNLSSFISSIAAGGTNDIRMGVLEYFDNTLSVKDFSGSEWTSDPAAVESQLLALAATNSGGTEKTMTALQTVMGSYGFRPNGATSQVKNVILITNEDADDKVLQGATLAALQGAGIRVHAVYNYASPGAVTDLDPLVTGTGGTSINLASPTWGSQLSSVIGATIGTDGGTTSSDVMPPVDVQIGAAAGETYRLHLVDARADKLGLNQVNCDTPEGARQALAVIDGAITRVSGARAQIGADQNVLGHVAANVAVQVENLSAAEARIVDADIAVETAELTRQDILVQSSTAGLTKLFDINRKTIADLIAGIR